MPDSWNYKIVAASHCLAGRLHKKVKDASSVEYPAYGVTGPAKEKTGSPGDRKLAQSAQMYHYQHQKQQMIASERFFILLLLLLHSPV